MPISINNRWNGEVIATVDDTDDLREAVIRLVRQGVSLNDADLSGARLDGASLVRASLVRASLVRASLVRASLDGASLDGASLDGASLVRASLDPIKNDMFAVLSYAPIEVPALITALEKGKVNGSTYSDGECGCLVGTLAMAAGADPQVSSSCVKVHDLHGDGGRPIECFFAAIKKGDTPESSQFAKLAHQWASEWYERIHVAFHGNKA